MVLDVVLHSGVASRDQLEVGLGLFKIDQPHLRGLMVVGRDVAVAAGGMPSDGNEKSGIGFGEHAHIRRHRRAQPMPEDSRRPVILIEPHVVEGRSVVGPNNRARRIRNDVGEIGSAVEGPDARRVEFGASVIGQPRQQAMVLRMGCGAEPEERLALCECVAVEQKFFRAALTRLATEQRMLPVQAITDVVSVGAVGVRHRQVVFFDPALHFGEQRVLQRRRVVQRTVAIVVLGLQIGADLRIQLLRVAHYLAPVRGLEPGELVAHRNAMERLGMRALLRPRFAQAGHGVLRGKLWARQFIQWRYPVFAVEREIFREGNLTVVAEFSLPALEPESGFNA